MIIEKIANRGYNIYDDFPHFVPREEREYNLGYANDIIEGEWIQRNWESWSERDNSDYNQFITKISDRGGIILDIGTGPGGGFMPVILLNDITARIIISDLCPTVLREWKKFFDTELQPPNIEYAALDTCDLPFMDESIDIVTDNGGFANIEGDKYAAIKGVHRILKTGGFYILGIFHVTNEYFTSLPTHAQEVLTARFPDIFHDYYDDFEAAGFTQIETTSTGSWSNENDNSRLADLCKELGIVLEFTSCRIICTK